jgi:dTDP-4-dehydrorhamnose reductase
VIHAAFALDEASIVAATANLVEAASVTGTDVLYLSTDAVFSGDGQPREESAPPDPIWDYGRWKATAEDLVSSRAASSAIVRLPLVVSLDPADRAVERIRRGAARGEPTAWFDDELRQPAMAPDIASALWRIASLAPDERAGPWQLPGSETLSRFEIAQRVVRALALDPGAIVAEHAPADASRPRHLHLRDDRARAQIDWDPIPILS